MEKKLQFQKEKQIYVSFLGSKEAKDHFGYLQFRKSKWITKG
jgi:hypothetical protein